MRQEMTKTEMYYHIYMVIEELMKAHDKSDNKGEREAYTESINKLDNAITLIFGSTTERMHELNWEEYLKLVRKDTYRKD